MRKLLTSLSRRRHPYEPLIKIGISRSRLLHNLAEFQKIAPNGRVAPVLKSNAYGHGLIEVASMLEREMGKERAKDKTPGIPFFVVDSYFEALALRSSKIRAPLLIIGYTAPDTIINSRLKDIYFTVGNLETLRAICDPELAARNSPIIHLKIDTGMRRQGILPEECGEAIKLIKDAPNLSLEGICSHLSDADNSNPEFTRRQISAWKKAVAQFKAAFPSLKYMHLSNTDGHRFSNEIEANVSRLGLGLFGIGDGSSFKPALDLRPVMEMKTIITGIKKLKKGETAGYGNTYKAMNDREIATIPVGYFEGVDRRLSDKGSILVGESRIPCPIIGRISMNITVIDVSRIKSLKIGSEAVVVSRNTEDPNSVRTIAEKCATIPYEIVVHIPGHLKRVIAD